VSGTPTARDPADLFRPFADCRTCLLAVSGGPDSMALVHLARDWSQSGGAALEVATVDHGLRTESAAECAQVAAWCRDLGLPHHSLRWEGPHPTSRIQERARDARCGLLFGLARQIGAEAVLTAHHLDDQAETVLFRLVKGSGLAGLAGMAPVSWREGLRLGRPLLSLTKAELVAICHARDQGYFEDPSNLDPRYARVRMRRLLALMAAEGLRPEDLVRLAARAARAEAALDACARSLFDRLAPDRRPDSYACDLSILRDEPEEFLLRLLCEEVGRLEAAPMRLERAERLAARLHAGLSTRQPVKSTLGGLVITLSSGGLLRLSPELARSRGRVRSIPVHVDD
jgi:tRNA(Ile)-lysidine synthase